MALGVMPTRVICAIGAAITGAPSRARRSGVPVPVFAEISDISSGLREPLWPVPSYRSATPMPRRTR
jgi:hypothetical protein